MPVPLSAEALAAVRLAAAAGASGEVLEPPPPPPQWTDMEQPLNLMHYEEQYRNGPGEEGEEELPPEDDNFYCTDEYMDMEGRWRRLFMLSEEVSEIGSARAMADRLRSLASEVEGLAGQGFVLDPEEMLDGGDEFVLVNPAIERAEWRARRQRRREARRVAEAAEAAAGGATGMETDEQGQAAAVQPPPGLAAEERALLEAAIGRLSPQQARRPLSPPPPKAASPRPAAFAAYAVC